MGYVANHELACFTIVPLMGFRHLGLSFLDKEKSVAHLTLPDDCRTVFEGLAYEGVCNFAVFHGQQQEQEGHC